MIRPALEAVQRLFDPAYLYAIDPGPLGRWKWAYFLWAVVLLAGAILAGRWRQRVRDADWNTPRAARGRLLASVAAWACVSGVLFLAIRLASTLPLRLDPDARYLIRDVWTVRVWPVSATLLAGMALLLGWLSRRRFPRAIQVQLDALTGAWPESEPPVSWKLQAGMGAIHLLGLAFLWYSAGRSALWSLPSLLVLSILPLLAPGHRPRLETLAPLLPAYLGAVGSFGLERGLGIDVVEYTSFAFPDPLSPWFDLTALIVGGVAYALWIQVRLLALRWRAAWRDGVLPAALCAALVLWLVATVSIHRTYGVTASDPYSYVQMTLDLARTGSPLHDFALAGLARDLGLPTWPTVHIGYHPPTDGNRAPTMWPIGWPLLMVPAYWIGGIDALYWMAPLMSVLALIVTWFASNEALRADAEEARATRWAVAALTCLFVATSPEGSERILVPMADAAAQLLTMLVLWLLLRGRRERPALHGLLAGVSLGAAYLVRHPQLPLGTAALVAALTIPAWRERGTFKRRIALLLAFGLGAFAVAIPDLIYHKAVFGGWLRSESTEWFLISAKNIGPSFFSVMRQGLLRREEVGLLAPLALLGCIQLRRKCRPAWLILGSGFLVVFLFHLCYAALRPRDLIAIVPVLYLFAAYGWVTVWRWGSGKRALGPALLMLCCALWASARSHRTLAMPYRDDVVTFGHVSAGQWQGLQELRERTPQEAVIGSMLNSGAIELHAGRSAVHPTPWTVEELYTWVAALQRGGRPFYVLDDGEEMEKVLSRLGARYELEEIVALDLPYFAVGGGNLPKGATLYRVGSERQ